MRKEERMHNIHLQKAKEAFDKNITIENMTIEQLTLSVNNVRENEILFYLTYGISTGNSTRWCRTLPLKIK